MNLLLCASLIVSSSWQEKGDAARFFLDRMDFDGDEKLSRAEWKSSGAAFLEYDHDRDAYITVAELRAGPMKLEQVRALAPAPDPDALRVALRAFPGDVPERLRSTCLVCHDEERILSARKNVAEWTETVERMRQKEDAGFSETEGKQALELLLRLRAPLAAITARYGSSDPALEWAAILDGAELFRFDRDRNGRLAGPEITRLLMDRLDFDGNGQLSRAEFSIMPLAQDRQEEFARADRMKDGWISEKELAVPLGFLQIFDADGDGAISPEEVPRARQGPFRILFVEDAALVLQTLDVNRDGKLQTKEMGANADYFLRFDESGDGALSTSEIERLIEGSRADGVLMAFDDFLARFDLDFNGKVTPLEYPGKPLAFRRLDRDGDGILSAKDAPPGYQAPEYQRLDTGRWR